jgi:hypothetical protein
MSDTDPDPTTERTGVATAPPGSSGTPTRDVVVERQVLQPAAPSRRRNAVGPFIAGFLTAVLAGALGIAIFLAVSDSDDDGQLELDVPAVDVDVDG